MAKSWRIGEFELRVEERRLLLGGETQVLGARAFDLLLALVEHRDRVVDKDELMSLVWPGVVVEENNLTVQVSALRKLLGANALTTVRGRGYRFTLAVADAASAPMPESPDSRAAARPAELDLMLPDKPSIAVLRFANLSGDAEQAYFTDGITEDVITELSRFRSIFVTARNSSFSYQDKDVDVRDVARELGVRYVLEGSIRRSADRVRVAAQLIDAMTGARVWAEKYDRVLDDIFEVQEELTQAIVAAIAPQIEASEFQKIGGMPLRNLTAYELAMRARDMARRADRDAEPHARQEALRLAQAAVALDSRCGTALATIAFIHWQQLWAGTAACAEETVEKGLAAAHGAISIDAADHTAHLWRGMLLMYSRRLAAGLADLRRAHELNPNDALTLSLLGQYEAGAGDARTGVLHVTGALRLSPRDGLRWSFFNSLAWAQFFAGAYLDAAESATRAINDAPRFHPPYVCLAISHIGLGEVAQAKAAYQVASELAPRAVAAWLSGTWNFASPELVERATAFLRRAAGLDGPAAVDAAHRTR